jgi:hypothetical protein
MAMLETADAATEASKADRALRCIHLSYGSSLPVRRLIVVSGQKMSVAGFAAVVSPAAARCVPSAISSD